MAEEKKIELKPEIPEETKPAEKKPVFKQEKPWEHFKNKNNGKNFKSHGMTNMNRRTGGGG
jgi:hypothetical protein